MRGTNEYLDIMNLNFEKLRLSRHFHVTGYACEQNHDSYLKLVKHIKSETDLTVSFDLGWDPTGIWSKKIYELFPYIDVLFMNQSEALNYSRKSTARSAAEDFASYCPLVAIKLGSKGALAAADGKITEKSSFQVKAVDTTGAGDSFNAGFIYAYLEGKSPEECLLYGNGCGALSVTKLGGNTGFPDIETLIEIINR